MNAARGFFRHDAFLAAAVALPLMVDACFLLATAIPRWTVPPPAYYLVLRVGKPYEPRPQVVAEFKVDDGKVVALVRPVQKDQYVQSWSLDRFDHQTSSLQDIPVKLPDSVPSDSPPQTIVVDGLPRNVRSNRRKRQTDTNCERTRIAEPAMYFFGAIGFLYGFFDKVKRTPLEITLLQPLQDSFTGRRSSGRARYCL